MELTATWDDTLGRVRIGAASLPAGTTSVRVERAAGATVWVTVRGGDALPVAAGATVLPADDYEAPAGEPVTYRGTALDSTGTALDTATTAITVQLDGPWLKVIARPFLNRRVTIQDWDEIEYASRSGVFPIIGTALPVAVASVRAGKATTVRIVTPDAAEREALVVALSIGDPIFLQVPADVAAPAGYFMVGDVSESRPYRKSVRRIFSLPVTEIGAPASSIVGSTATWQTILNNQDTWGDVRDTYSTWADLLETIGKPADVVTP